MTKAKILADIADYEELLADGDTSSLAKELAREEILQLQLQLSQMDEAAPTAPASESKQKATRGRPKNGEQSAPKQKRSRKPFEGDAVDRDGESLSIGDQVQAEIAGQTVMAEIINLMKHAGGGHQIRYTSGGKVRTPMVNPSKIRKIAPGEDAPAVVDFDQPLPAELVQSAQTADRADCDENETILVTPTEAVTLNAPMMADPEKGDVIVVNPDGHPVAVIMGSEKKKHFKTTGKANVLEQADGTVEFEQPSIVKKDLETENQPDGQTHTPQVEDITPMRAVKAKRPPAGACQWTREQAKSPALKTFLEGMRQGWHNGDRKDKITGVYWLKEAKQIVLRIKVYDWLEIFGSMKYYTVCMDTAKLTKVEKPQRAGLIVLFGEDAMKVFYRYPFGSSCKTISKALYVECYREGNCTDEKKRRLYNIFAQKCSRVELEHSREYMKYVHAKTHDKWDGYTGSKTYAQVFSEVLKGIRMDKAPTPTQVGS